jgi:hypothetical protein
LNAATGMSVSITPSSLTSKILVVASINGCHSPSNNDSFVRLLRGSTAISIGDTAGSRTPATFQMGMVHLSPKPTHSYGENLYDSSYTVCVWLTHHRCQEILLLYPY